MSEELVNELSAWRKKMPANWYGNPLLDRAIAALAAPAAPSAGAVKNKQAIIQEAHEYLKRQGFRISIVSVEGALDAAGLLQEQPAPAVSAERVAELERMEVAAKEAAHLLLAYLKGHPGSKQMTYAVKLCHSIIRGTVNVEALVDEYLDDGSTAIAKQGKE